VCDADWNCRAAEKKPLGGHSTFRELDEEEFRDLVENIRDHGVLHAPGVRCMKDGSYRLIWGFRRVAACKTIDPAMVIAFRLVPACNEADARVYNISENVHHKRFHPHELAEALHRAHEEAPEISLSELARRCGISANWAQKLCRVRSKLHPAVWEAYARDYLAIRISEMDELAKLPPAQQLDAWNQRVKAHSKTGSRGGGTGHRTRGDRPTVSKLAGYLRSVRDLDGSEDFRAGATYAFKVALGQEASRVDPKRGRT
jgi:ParB/RepB/Spo0J family partition protein